MPSSDNSFRLVVESQTGRSISLNQDKCIGRYLVKQELGTDDPTISREHCQIRWLGRNFWIRDGSKGGLPSLTGTLLDGRRLHAEHWEIIPQQASLLIGQTTLILRQESPAPRGFDIMISYSRKDATPVFEICQLMRDAGITPWIDQTSNLPAAHYLEDIENILAETNAVAVFWGGDHMGDTQRAEVRVVTSNHIHRKIKSIFLIVLPDSSDPQWSAFLNNIDYYDLRKPGESGRLFRDLPKALLPRPEMS
jgi:hypothetical protein